ncbi:hypothetical protein DHODJN_00670 [Methylorubrum extorquens]
MEETLVPAADVCHLYRAMRPGQDRGEPWLARALRTLYDLDGYLDAELVRKKNAARFVGFIKRILEDGADGALGGGPRARMRRTMMVPPASTSNRERWRSWPTAKMSRSPSRQTAAPTSSRTCARCCAASRWPRASFRAERRLRRAERPDPARGVEHVPTFGGGVAAPPRGLPALPAGLAPLGRSRPALRRAEAARGYAPRGRLRGQLDPAGVAVHPPRAGRREQVEGDPGGSVLAQPEGRRGGLRRRGDRRRERSRQPARRRSGPCLHQRRAQRGGPHAGELPDEDPAPNT